MSIWDNIKDIVILFESDNAEGNTDIQDIILQLRAAGKKVSAWGYTPKYKIYTPPSTIFRILGKEDTTLCNNKVRKKHLQVWQSLPCDLLMDLTLQDVLPLQHLADTSPANLKASIERKSSTHQFMIQLQDPSRTALYQQIVHYLKAIQS